MKNAEHLEYPRQVPDCFLGIDKRIPNFELRKLRNNARIYSMQVRRLKNVTHHSGLWNWLILGVNMLVPINTTIIIKSTPEAIWDYAYDPVNWTASNAKEHYGLKFNAPDNKPHTGTTFQQKESVAGIKAELRGHLPFVDRPKMAFWRGIATYRILLFTVRIPEGGVLTLQKTENGTKLSHNVWMDFPDTLMGRITLWYFRRRNLEKAIYDHTFRELEFFKQQLESNANSP